MRIKVIFLSFLLLCIQHFSFAGCQQVENIYSSNEYQSISNSLPNFRYHYNQENGTILIYKNNIPFQSMDVLNDLESVYENDVYILFFVKEFKCENLFIAEYLRDNLLNMFEDASKYYTELLRQLRRLKLYVFDKMEEKLFCAKHINCFLNLPKNAYMDCDYIEFEIDDADKIQPDCIRIELPES